MKIQIDDTHEGRFLTVDHGEETIELDLRLIGSLDNRYILRPVRNGYDDGILKYNVSLCENIRGYLTNRRMDRTELVGFLAQLKSVVRALEDHMLTDANILLDPEYVFIDRVTRKARFVPVCRLEGTFSGRLRPLIETIFCHADLEDTESLRFAAKMMRAVLTDSLKMHTLMELADVSLSAVKQERRGPQPETYGREAGNCGMNGNSYFRTAESCIGAEEVTVLLSDMKENAEGGLPGMKDMQGENVRYRPGSPSGTGGAAAGNGISGNRRTDALPASEEKTGHGVKGFFSNLASRFKDEEDEDE